ncbi:MAG: DUF5011 domain-containing protein, partial [Clostridiaceae bacterium]|nr:DUF5011 domain-containing protein [Clostridiaceae bacterium]
LIGSKTINADLDDNGNWNCKVSNLSYGNYIIKAQALDAKNNVLGESQVNVIYPEVDTIKPVITLKGGTETVEAGTTYVDKGATASDNYDKDITSKIVIVNPVNINVVGDYVVTYNVTDINGNKAVQVTRTVHVILAKIFEGTNNSGIVNAVKNGTAGTAITVNSATKASKEVLVALKGKDITVAFVAPGITWTINGKDLTGNITSDIDLTLKPVSADLLAKEKAKIKAVSGKDQDIVAFSFNYDGKLPGNFTVKIFLRKDLANKTVNIYRYDSSKNTYERVFEGAKVDAAGNATFTINHCSDYFALSSDATTSNNAKLPKTGSVVDINVIVASGIILIMGGLILLLNKRKRA